MRINLPALFPRAARLLSCLLLTLLFTCAIHAQSTEYTVQVGSLPSRAAAQDMVRRLQSRGLDAYSRRVWIPRRGVFYRVRVGRLAAPGEACALDAAIAREGLAAQRIVTTWDEEEAVTLKAPVEIDCQQFPVGPSGHDPLSTRPRVSQAPQRNSEDTPPRISLEARFWMGTLDARANVSGVFLRGTDIDLKPDLGLRDRNLPEGRLTWHISRNSRLTVGYARADYSGDNTAARRLQFRDQAFTPGARVQSRIEVRQLQLSYAWTFINIANRFRIGPVAEARRLWVDAAVGAPGAVSDTRRLNVWLPSFGAAVDIQPHRRLRVFGMASGLKALQYGHFFNAEAGVEMMPIRHLWLMGGYRTLDARARQAPDFANVRLRGPFFAVGAKF